MQQQIRSLQALDHDVNNAQFKLLFSKLASKMFYEEENYLENSFVRLQGHTMCFGEKQ